MRALSLAAGAPLARILAVGAHADDIEIGCGGTLLSLVRAHPGLEIWWLVLSAIGEREAEARSSAASFLSPASVHLEVHGFRDGFLPTVAVDVKEVFEELKGRLLPDLVLTHRRDDAHQDHRLACELTWNTFRDQLILEYEVPKWDGDLGRPNHYVPLSHAVAHEKAALLGQLYPSQASKHWFEAETFLGLMRLRGLEVNAPERYAEAFVARKVKLLP
jgi:LmbE family N-acetylglucosaminyl deacetylase